MLPIGSTSKLGLPPLASEPSFTEKAYSALKDVITRMDLYGTRDDIRLDERQLASDLGVSRTPVREALAQLEREGFVRSVPRRGIYVVRKTRREVIELITAWAALEGMAARLATEKASDQEISALRRMFTTFEGGEMRAKLDEYSEVNIEFHQAIIRMSHNQVLIDMAENLFTHMRMIRRKTIGEMDRADRSIRDHMNIIEALEARDTNRAEELVRNHALGLAAPDCIPVTLISAASVPEVRVLEQGQYEELDQLAIAKPLCTAGFRLLHAPAVDIGIARAIRTAVSRRPRGAYLDLPAKFSG